LYAAVRLIAKCAVVKTAHARQPDGTRTDSCK